MKYRCAVIGLGRIGCGFDDSPNATTVSTHAGAYYQTKKTKLVTFCDIDKSKLVKYGPKYNVTRLHTDYQQMFRDEKLDIISICTHANFHRKIVEAACRAGIRGIYLEKPISDSLIDARKIIEICAKNKVKLQINHQRRFDPFYHKLKKIINTKKFGRIQHFNVYYGAGIANTGSHICDLIRYLFDDIKWVEGTLSSNPSNNIQDPNIDGSIMCKNGVKCNIFGFDYSQYGIIEFDIIATGGRIKLNLTTGKTEFFRVSPPKIGLYYNELVEVPFSAPPKTSAIYRGLENLLYSVEKDQEPLCSGNDGYASLEAIIALMKSTSKNGKRILLPLKDTNHKINSK